MKKARIWAHREFVHPFTRQQTWIWYVQRPEDHGPQTFSTFWACFAFLRLVSRESINVSSNTPMRIPFQYVVNA